MNRVSVYDGKYTVVWGGHQTRFASLRALRHGQEWRDLAGDGLVLALAIEIQKLRERLGLDLETGA